jgi:predicted RNase H-like HicB family nuclease
MSAEKTLEKLLRGQSDANIRFDELCHLLQAKGFRMRISGSHPFHPTRRNGTHQPPARRLQRQAISSSTSPQNSGKLQTNMKPNRYEMIVWWSDEDTAYVVDVPELPGCMAHGSTRRAAIKNAEDAIKFWIKTAKDDGLEIPSPRGRLVFA